MKTNTEIKTEINSLLEEIKEIREWKNEDGTPYNEGDVEYNIQWCLFDIEKLVEQMA